MKLLETSNAAAASSRPAVKFAQTTIEEKVDSKAVREWEAVVKLKTRHCYSKTLSEVLDMMNWS